MENDAQGEREIESERVRERNSEGERGGRERVGHFEKRGEQFRK